MNDSICLFVWRMNRVLMVLPKFLLLIPAAIFKNLLAIISGTLNITFLVLILLSVLWLLLLLPLLTFSILSRIPIIGWLFSLVGLPFAIMSEIFMCLMPSFAVLYNTNDENARAYWSKVAIAESYPFSIEFSPLKNRFQMRGAAKTIFEHFMNQPIIKSFIGMEA